MKRKNLLKQKLPEFLATRDIELASLTNLQYAQAGLASFVNSFFSQNPFQKVAF